MTIEKRLKTIARNQQRIYDAGFAAGQAAGGDTNAAYQAGVHSVYENMTQETIKIRKLTAGEGMTLYNGEAFGKEVYLGANDSPENWQEIPDAEAERIRSEQNDQIDEIYT